MLMFILRRLLAGLVLVFFSALVVFWLMSLSNDTVARTLAGQSASQAQVAQKATELGLDQPFFTRFFDWLSGLLHGDLGSSWVNGQPVTTIVADKVPVTLSILLVGLLVAAVLSVLIGVAAAVRGGWLDRAVQGLAILGFAVPAFLVALLLAVVFAVHWKIFPAVGYTPLAQSPSGWLMSITLPAIALAIGAMAATAQQVRGSMVDVLGADFVRTLRSRGLSERSLLFRHALRNAIPPGLTVLALQFIGLVGGAVIVEKVFGLYGIGTAITSASTSHDQPVVLGITLVLVIIVVVVNLVLDLAYGLLNPKVRVA